MKKVLLILSVAVSLGATAQQSPEKTKPESAKVQEKTYRLSRNSGKIQINLTRAVIEGYAGNEIVFSISKGATAEDERAKGLRAVNSFGLEDNTGLGINVEDKNGTVVVNQLKRMNEPEVKIMVPKGMSVGFSHQSQFGGKVVLRNIEKEIEISSQYNNIELENITGPATVKSVYGSIDAVFSQNVKGPLSILSIYGRVDVTLPEKIKADLQASTSYGDIFISPDFKIETEKAENIDMFGDQLKGKLNGGGLNVKLVSEYSKIYLRAK